MKLSYSVQNLRRLSSMQNIEIRPITILLGRNSVGKSTFLRSFPLLRQSIETKSSAPILWFGDYVDFGNFSSAVTDNDEDRKIGFSFEMKEYNATFRSSDPFRNRYTAYRNRSQKFEIDHLKVTYSVGARYEGTDRDAIAIELPNTSSALNIEFESYSSVATSIKFNDTDLTELLSGVQVYFPADSLFSAPVFLEKMRDKKTTRLVVVSRTKTFLTLIEKELEKQVDGRTRRNRISSEARRILRHDAMSTESVQTLARAETVTFQRIYNRLIEDRKSELWHVLDSICQANFLFNLLEAVGENLSEFFESVEYIGPARARSERFYRQQELEVSEISPDGKNLPMFLASLDQVQLSNFSDWVKQTFGYGVFVHKTAGHVSINLRQGDQGVNVVDTG